jgi:hypothetical protein
MIRDMMSGQYHVLVIDDDDTVCPLIMGATYRIRWILLRHCVAGARGFSRFGNAAPDGFSDKVAAAPHHTSNVSRLRFHSFRARMAQTGNSQTGSRVTML